MSSDHLMGKLLARLGARRRVQLAAALLLMILSGAAEAFSLAAVLPFLWVLTNPGALWQWPIVRRISPLLGLSHPADLLLPAVLLFSAAVLFAAAIRLANVWLNAQLS